MTILLSSITEGERARKEYGDLSGLRESIQRIGTIHPIVLSRAAHDGSFTLIAGGRRFRAMQELKIEELHHGSTLDPLRPGFLFADEVPLHVRKAAELDENLYRLKTQWTEDVLLVAETHEAFKAKDIAWGQAQTAQILGDGYGSAKVNYCLKVAKALRQGDTAIVKAKDLSTALAIFTRRKEDEAIHERQERIKEKRVSVPAPTPLEQKEDLAPPPPREPSTNIDLSFAFKLGDFRDLSWPTCDHIVTDIPYAIDMKHLDDEGRHATGAIEDLKDTHDVQANLDLYPAFLQRSFTALRPGGFLVFFYDLDHHEKLRDMATAVGFKVQRWPFIAAKTSPCKNNAAQFNTTKNYEVAMFCRKDSHTVLRDPLGTSWKTYNFAEGTEIFDNPFAKPPKLWLDIFTAIAFPGQTILDPFAGECSSLLPALDFGLIPLGMEKHEGRYNRGAENLRRKYSSLYGNCSFT